MGPWTDQYWVVGGGLQAEGMEIVIEDMVGATGLELKSDPGVPWVYAGFAGAPAPATPPLPTAPPPPHPPHFSPQRSGAAGPSMHALRVINVAYA